MRVAFRRECKRAYKAGTAATCLLVRPPIRRGGTVQQAQAAHHRPCSPLRAACSVPARRALWSAIRSASSVGALSRGAAAPCPEVRCPFDVFLEASTEPETLACPNLSGLSALTSVCQLPVTTAGSRRWGRTLPDALDNRGRDAREHGLGLRGLQYIDERVRPWRLPLRLATAEDIPKLTGLLM